MKIDGSGELTLNDVDPYKSAAKSVIIQYRITTIGGYAFVACFSLIDVYYTGTIDDWNNISINGCNRELGNATIHYLPQ